MRFVSLAAAWLLLASCQLVTSDGDACLNDGNCPAGLTCCDGQCRGVCNSDERGPGQIGFSALLTVAVLSDFTPLVDFDEVLVQLDGGSEVSFTPTVAIHFDKPRAVAVFQDVALGDRRVIVTLFSGGAAIAQRHVDFRLVADIELGVALSRACLFMVCPGSGDPLDAEVCHGGRCVSPSCSSVDLASCGNLACTEDTDCASTTGCGVAACVDGLCVERPEDSKCPDDEICHVGVGCVPQRPQCTTDEACDDHIACTRDRCVVGQCHNIADDSVCGETRCEPYAKAASASTGCSPTSCAEGECARDCEGLAAGEICRASTGVCDPVEVCNGMSPFCPADLLGSITAICRDSGGSCDDPEYCTGASNACPSDLLKTGQVCRPSAGPCDVAEICDGAPTCPTDAFRVNTTVCREQLGGCDQADTCTGNSAACPQDKMRPVGFVCGSSEALCQNDSVCDGVSNVCPPRTLKDAGTLCRAASGVCDVEDRCSGTSAACPNNIVPDGTQCACDDSTCYSCSAGVCG